jgi:tol-pal system protein YbgF
MGHRRRLIVMLLAACAIAAPAAAQNRVELTLLLEMRTLQNSVQQLTEAINAVAEHLKRTDSLLEGQANALLKGFADQKVLINELSQAQRTLGEREGEVSVRVLQLNQEMKAIREGLAMQQTLLNQILAQLPQPAAATAAGAEPTAPPAAQPPPKTGADIPPSPGEYYSAAFNYFYKGQFDSAVDTLTDAIKRYPDSPEAARAQLTIGDAYQAMGGHDAEALAAYQLVIKNYKDPEVLPDAYLKQGDTLERLGQKDSARKSYEDVRKLFPNSSAAIFAQAALKRLGYIKLTSCN